MPGCGIILAMTGVFYFIFAKLPLVYIFVLLCSCLVFLLFPLVVNANLIAFGFHDDA